MAELDAPIKRALAELADRRRDIRNLKNPNTIYGITPPNYKGNSGSLDFYVCQEVDPLAHVPPGMMHIRMPARLYAKTTYQGPPRNRDRAYAFTTLWLRENGYTYDDVDYYFEAYDEGTNLEQDEDENSVIAIYCPVRKI